MTITGTEKYHGYPSQKQKTETKKNFKATGKSAKRVEELLNECDVSRSRRPSLLISVERENKIRALLDAGESIFSVCRELKAGAESVKRVRDSDGPLDRSRKEILSKRKLKPYDQRNTGVLHNLKRAKRCPDCGAMVLLWPCLACNPQVGCY